MTLLGGGETEFRVLGPLEVVDDGRPVAVGAGRQTLLLSCLLLRANETVSRDVLVEVLSRERPTASVRNALQVQVHALRKRLGQERIATEGAGYRLCVAADELDLERFERLVAQGRDELAAGDADGAASTLRKALELWRGPALDDVAYESFAQAEIARLEELRLVALEERIEAELALARHGELVAELEALVSAHPSRERLHGQLMLALYRAGRQRDALAVFRRARRALREELGLEPGPGLQKLQQAILRQDAVLHVEPPELRQRRHLPAPSTPLLGRRREVDEIGALLRGTGARLVTLTGAGGSGKTRLALQIAHDLADAFPDGVYFVDLAPLREPALVPSAIAKALGAEHGSNEPPAETLRAHLRDRRVLLLLDNFEVVDEAAPLLTDLLGDAPELAVLVTSRTPLRLSAEHEYRVPPLPLREAARLFAERARAVAPGFRRPSEEAEEVAEICRRLDCLPLTIELAAARTRDYSAAEMLEALPSSLDLAGAGARDLPARQRTLRATIDWSYELLLPDEQALLARLAVFAGGCTVPAVEAVCAAGRGALASLVGKSLLLERLGGAGELRFWMLDTIRDYALERLERSGEAQTVRLRHANFFHALAEEARTHLHGARQTEWLARLDSERDNLRAVLGLGLETGAPELTLRLAVALERFWWVRRPAEGLDWLQRGLEAGEIPPALRAAALEAAGETCWFVGRHEQAARLIEESGTIYRRLGDRGGEARILNRLGPPLMVAGKHGEAEALVRKGLELNRDLGNMSEVVLSLQILGASAFEQGDVNKGVALTRESLELAREIGDLESVAVSLANLADATLLLDDPSCAAALGREALALACDLGNDRLTVGCLSILAVAAAHGGDPRRAGVLWGAADRMAEEHGPSHWARERPRLASMLGDPGAAFEQGRNEGRVLSPADAAALALADGRTARADPLASTRER